MRKQSRKAMTAKARRWAGFTRRFRTLITAQAEPGLFTVLEDIDEDRQSSMWNVPPSLRAAGFLPRFEEVAKEAGRCLGARRREDPVELWYDRLSIYMWRHETNGCLWINDLAKSGIRYRVRVINGVIEASTRFSRWLSKPEGKTVRALMDFSTESPPWKSLPLPDQQEQLAAAQTGPAWAAEMNRREAVRASLVRKLQELAVPYNVWPDFVQTWHSNPHNRLTFSNAVPLPSFQPPDYDRLVQTIEEWVETADEAWKRHRDRFVQSRKFWEGAGVDESIPPRKSTRGPVEDRYRWAALRLSGLSWKEVSARAQLGTSTVTKAASQILDEADWPTKPRAMQAAASQAGKPKG